MNRSKSMIGMGNVTGLMAALDALFGNREQSESVEPTRAEFAAAQILDAEIKIKSSQIVLDLFKAAPREDGKTITCVNLAGAKDGSWMYSVVSYANEEETDFVIVGQYHGDAREPQVQTLHAPNHELAHLMARHLGEQMSDREHAIGEAADAKAAAEAAE